MSIKRKLICFIFFNTLLYSNLVFSCSEIKDYFYPREENERIKLFLEIIYNPSTVTCNNLIESISPVQSTQISTSFKNKLCSRLKAKYSPDIEVINDHLNACTDVQKIPKSIPILNKEMLNTLFSEIASAAELRDADLINDKKAQIIHSVNFGNDAVRFLKDITIRPFGCEVTTAPKDFMEHSSDTEEDRIDFKMPKVEGNKFISIDSDLNGVCRYLGFAHYAKKSHSEKLGTRKKMIVIKDSTGLSYTIKSKSYYIKKISCVPYSLSSIDRKAKSKRLIPNDDYFIEGIDSVALKDRKGTVYFQGRLNGSSPKLKKFFRPIIQNYKKYVQDNGHISFQEYLDENIFNHKLKTIRLKSAFKSDFGIPPKKAPAEVARFSEIERKKMKTSINKNGVLVDASGNLYKDDNETYVAVMQDPNNLLVTGKSSKSGLAIHDTSILGSNWPAYASGRIKVDKKGRVISISGIGDAYSPQAIHVNQIAKHLAGQGLVLHDLKLTNLIHDPHFKQSYQFKFPQLFRKEIPEGQVADWVRDYDQLYNQWASDDKNVPPIKDEDDIDYEKCGEKGHKDIPRIMHIIWIGSALPDDYIDNLQKTLKLNSKYRLKIWYDPELLDNEQMSKFKEQVVTISDKDSSRVELKSIVDEDFGDNRLAKYFKEQLRNIKKGEVAGMNTGFVTWAYWADIIRYGALKKYGGIYMDAKQGITKNIGNLATQSGPCDELLVRNPGNMPPAANLSSTTASIANKQVNNDVIIAAKNSPILKEVFKSALDKTQEMLESPNGRIQLIYPTVGNRGRHTFHNTGPVHFTEAVVKARGSDATSMKMAGEYFNPNFAKAYHQGKVKTNLFSTMPRQLVDIFGSTKGSLSWASKRTKDEKIQEFINKVEDVQKKILKNKVLNVKSNNSYIIEAQKLAKEILKAGEINKYDIVKGYEGEMYGDYLYKIEKKLNELMNGPESSANDKIIAKKMLSDIHPDNHVLKVINEETKLALSKLSQLNSTDWGNYEKNLPVEIRANLDYVLKVKKQIDTANSSSENERIIDSLSPVYKCLVINKDC